MTKLAKVEETPVKPSGPQSQDVNRINGETKDEFDSGPNPKLKKDALAQEEGTPRRSQRVATKIEKKVAEEVETKKKKKLDVEINGPSTSDGPEEEEKLGLALTNGLDGEESQEEKDQEEVDGGEEVKVGEKRKLFEEMSEDDLVPKKLPKNEETGKKWRICCVM